MISHPSDRPISALRARMIEDMSVRGFSEKTRNNYIRNVRAFDAFIGRSPDTATAEDLRRFQLQQAQSVYDLLFRTAAETLLPIEQSPSRSRRARRDLPVQGLPRQRAGALPHNDAQR